MVLPHVNEEPLPSFQLDEPLDDVPVAPRDHDGDAANVTRARKAFDLREPNRTDPSEIAKTRVLPKFTKRGEHEAVSESHVRARTSSLPPPNPPRRGAVPAKVEHEREARVELELPKLEMARPIEIPENLAALANAVETYAFSSESSKRAPSEIEIEVEIEPEPPKVDQSFDAALKAAGWKPVPTDFAAPAMRLDRPFGALPKLNDESEAPSTIPPRSSMSMRVVSIPPQPVPSLPVPSPVDLEAEYEILVRKKGSSKRRVVWVLIAVLPVAAAALLTMPDVTGSWIEAVRAPLRGPLHDLGVDLPKP